MPSGGGTGEEEFSLPPESKHPGSASSGDARPPFTKREVDAGELLPLFQ